MPAINKQRQEKKQNARERGLTNKAYKKIQKKAQKILLKAKSNFEEIKRIYERVAAKILLDNNISVERLDVFFNEGVLFCQYFINHDSEAASDLEDRFDIAISDLGIDHWELHSVIVVNFISLDDEEVESSTLESFAKPPIVKGEYSMTDSEIRSELMEGLNHE